VPSNLAVGSAASTSANGNTFETRQQRDTQVKDKTFLSE